MRGLLMDVNVQGHLAHLRRQLEALGLWELLVQLNLELVTFPDLGLPQGLNDRAVWHHCQKDGWVLFTENRNQDDPDSLQTTLADSWQPGLLPVVTLANKGKFEHSPEYAQR